MGCASVIPETETFLNKKCPIFQARAVGILAITILDYVLTDDGNLLFNRQKITRASIKL